MKLTHFALLAFSLGAATSAGASDCVNGPNLIVNGSFEGGCTPATYTVLSAGSTCLAPWQVIPTGTVDLVGPGIWVSSDLLYSVDLAGDDPGGVSQSFPTTIGELYSVRFDLAAHPYASSNPTKFMSVEVDTVPLQYANFTSTTTGDINNLGWEQVDWSFTAEATTTTITFRSTDPWGNAGATLDDVQVALACDGSGSSFCDSSGGNCPCLPGGNGAGCQTTSTSGAILFATGNAVLSSADTFQLCVTGIPGAKVGLCVKGSTTLGNGNGSPIGDGLLCTSPQLRSQVIVSSESGTVTMTNWRGQPFSTYPGVANTGNVPTYYQWWYRDPGNSCAGADFNFTNAWEVTW